jgi:hypothetical protein
VAKFTPHEFSEIFPGTPPKMPFVIDRGIYGLEAREPFPAQAGFAKAILWMFASSAFSVPNGGFFCV